jgi:hypothetical protein
MLVFIEMFRTKSSNLIIDNSAIKTFSKHLIKKVEIKCGWFEKKKLHEKVNLLLIFF